MVYATATQLRARYRRSLDDADEFAAHDDAHLERALAAAASELDSWRPAGVLSDAATAVLTDKCLTLARLHAHQDAALDESHPIVREALAVRDWLKALAAGRVVLPAADAVALPASGLSAPVVTAPAVVFGADWAERYS